MSIRRVALVITSTVAVILAALVNVPAHSTPPPAFITRWDTTLTSAGSSGINQVRLPLTTEVPCNFLVEWGDGSSDTITGWNLAAQTHTYAAPGIYTVTITGAITGWRFDGTGDRLKLLEVQSWGPLVLGNWGDYFEGAANMTSTATDAPDLSMTTDLSDAFSGATDFNGTLNTWDTSTVTDMSRVFQRTAAFNQDISTWDTSNVTTMDRMFSSATAFNQPIGTWNTGNVTTMEAMFAGATAFNQPIGTWNTAKVTTMHAMFDGAAAFNQDIDFDPIAGTWNTGNVTDMDGMLANTAAFNQPIGTWNTAKVTTMHSMFKGATAFNQPIGTWNTSAVLDMGWMFAGATAFNGDVGAWDTHAVVDMGNMFRQAGSFDQNIGYDPIAGTWDTSNVEQMGSMFNGAATFNQPIGTWKTGKVTIMNSMFSGADAFDQNIGGWDVRQVFDMQDMFSGAQLSPANYDALLMGWTGLGGLTHDVVFSAGSSKYSVAAAANRQTLIDTYRWTITDGGPALPGISATPNPVVYDDQRIGTTSAYTTVTVTNPGHAPLALGAVTLVGDQAGQFGQGQDTCSGSTLTPAQSCTVLVAFTPTSAGPKTGQLQLASNAPGSPLVVTLSGTGTEPPAPPTPTPTPTPTGSPAPPVPPAPQAQTIARIVKQMKTKKRASLPKRTQQGASVTWKSASKKVCTVKGARVKALRKGTCRLTATAPAITGYMAFTKGAKIRVK